METRSEELMPCPVCGEKCEVDHWGQCSTEEEWCYGHVLDRGRELGLFKWE